MFVYANYPSSPTSKANDKRQDHSAALALVSVHKQDASTSADGTNNTGSSGVAKTPHDDVDMRRAMDLVELHYGVKMNHLQAGDAELKQARMDVDRVLEKLERKKQNTSNRDM